MIRNRFFLIVILPVLILCSGAIVSCKSKKNCAQFENPDKEFHVKYSKGGLVKKKGRRNKPAWEGK